VLTAAQVAKLAETRVVVQSHEPSAQYENTDLGNARRLVDAYGVDLRFVPEWGKWIAWTGRRWEIDITGVVYRKAKVIAEQILDEARAGADEKMFRWGRRSQSASGIENAIRMASTEPEIPLRVDQLDANPWLLAVANGTLNLRTGELQPHDRDDLITKMSPIGYDPAAQCPRFDAFLSRILPDPDVREFMQRLVGYALTGDVSEQILAILYGTGANGKSTLKEAVLAVLGDHGKPASPKLLLATKHDEHPTSIADLHGRRLVISHEVAEGVCFDEPLVKELTGGDRLKARFMRQDFWDFTPTHKLWLLTNHKPKIRGTDHAIWRRIRLVPFTATIPSDEQDHALPAALRAELPGILAWATRGCVAWQRDGLTPPPAVVEATAAYRVENDLVGQFLADTCIIGDGCQVRSADLYGAYAGWCAGNGLTQPLSQKALAQRLGETFERTENRAGQRIWLGIDLVATDEETTP